MRFFGWTLHKRIGELQRTRPKLTPTADLDRIIDGLKFSECLPHDITDLMVRSRLTDERGVNGVLDQPVRFVQLGGD
jgi:hypothetical protein